MSKARPEPSDVRAEHAGRARDRDGAPSLDGVGVFRADVDVALGRAHGEPAIAMPSIRVKGSPSISMRSAKVPLSPSSALQTMYFWSPGVRTVFHLMPVGKPAPPRPRRPAPADRPAVDHRRRGAGAEAKAEDRLQRHRAVGRGSVPVDARRPSHGPRQRSAPIAWQASARQSFSTWRPAGSSRKSW
jgi:hypothetical protein